MEQCNSPAESFTGCDVLSYCFNSNPGNVWTTTTNVETSPQTFLGQSFPRSTNETRDKSYKKATENERKRVKQTNGVGERKRKHYEAVWRFLPFIRRGGQGFTRADDHKGSRQSVLDQTIGTSELK